MPTPPAIVDAAQTIGDAYVATAGLFDQFSLFAALAIGMGLASWLFVKAKRAVRR